MKPFLRWAGGKTSLVPELLRHLPPRETFRGTYYEPFLGGGALFFAYAPKSAVLGDINKKLIETYQVVRGGVDDQFVRALAHLDDDAETYASVRAHFNGERYNSPVTSAAYFIYLNKTCFNGLWRVNRRGGFNVPYNATRAGRRTICDMETLGAASKALQGTTLYAGEFSKSNPRPGDVIYFDPPYWPVSATSNFTAYAKEPFGPAAQEHLRDYALALKKRGVHVVLSNADVAPVRKLYARGFTLHEVQARRNINSKGDRRGKVGELIIT